MAPPSWEESQRALEGVRRTVETTAEAIAGDEKARAGAYGALGEQLKALNVAYFTASCDPVDVQKKFAEQEGYDFSVLADFWPHGAVASAYGVFLEDSGISNRATFVINKDGVLVAKFVTAPGQARSLDEYKRALASL